jgi:hypothetical protein
MNDLPGLSDFNLDPTYLFLGLIPGAVGMVFLVYGRKQDRPPFAIAGVLLMLYPFFTGTSLGLLLVGSVICAGLWLAIRMGW